MASDPSWAMLTTIVVRNGFYLMSENASMAGKSDCIVVNPVGRHDQDQVLT